MEKIKPRTLSGFMELLPERQMHMERMMAVLRESFALYGFTPLDTPIIESAEVLLAKGGGETDKQIYELKRGDTNLALRFDLTVPLAKYVAKNYASLAFPFKRYQIGKVYRGERAQRGRFREFYQADIDVIGDGSLDIISDAEIPAIIYRVFSAMGLRKFKIRVNNRKLLNGFFELCGQTERAGDIMRAIDKLDKIGAEKVRELILDLGTPENVTDDIMSFIGASGDSAERFDALSGYRGRSDLFDAGFGELSAVAGLMSAFGVPDSNFEIDFTIARGLDYYTGTVYETIMTEHPEIGSICSGGRYDNLAEYYTERKLPGVGISIGLTRLFYVLDEQGYLNGELSTAPADVLVLPMAGDLGVAAAAATVLRGRGVRVQMHCEDKKLKAKLQYADKLKIPFVLFIGEEEISLGKVTLKNLDTGAQQTLAAEEAAEIVAAYVESRNRDTVLRDK